MNAYPERAREGVFSTFEERKQVARGEEAFPRDGGSSASASGTAPGTREENTASSQP